MLTLQRSCMPWEVARFEAAVGVAHWCMDLIAAS